MNHETLPALIDASLANANPAHVFLDVDGSTLTFGELSDRIARLQSVFAAKGLVPGAHVGILSRSAADVVTLLLGGLRAGFAVINLNPELTASEQAVALGAARIEHLFADADLLAEAPAPDGMATTRIGEAPRVGGGRLRRLLDRGAPVERSLADEIAAATPAQSLHPGGDPEATALMLFTSGTTSRPKVVELSARNLLAQVETFHGLYRYGPDCRILNPLPLHFTDGLLHGPIMACLSGATLLRPARFEIGQTGSLLRQIKQDRITHFIVVPALLSLMRRLDSSYDDAFACPDFRYIRSSGDRLPEALWRETEDRFGVRVANTYGLSETVCEALYCGPDDALYRFGSVGKPVDCEARVIDAEGKPVADGLPGELAIRGDNIMKGYLGQPEMTAETVVDGWLMTGDLATRDAEGFFTIVGRKKTLIVTGGINVQPQEVADALMRHPRVCEAYVLGLPDPDFNEVVACALVLRDAPVNEAAAIAELAEHCRSLLAPKKVPRRFLLLRDLSRNPAGKVLGAELVRLFEAERDNIPVGADGRGEDTLCAIIAIAAQAFRVDPVDLSVQSTPFNTPGWDSLAHLSLISGTERRFALTFAPSEIMEIGALGELASLVARKRGAARPGMVHELQP